MTEIFKLLTAELSSDGQHVTMTFESDLEPVIIEANANALRTIVADLAAVIRHDSRPSTNTMVSAMKPDQFFAGPDGDRREVLIGFRGANAPEHLFALIPKDATSLQKKIADAVKRCRPA